MKNFKYKILSKIDFDEIKLKMKMLLDIFNNLLFTKDTKIMKANKIGYHWQR